MRLLICVYREDMSLALALGLGELLQVTLEIEDRLS